MDWIHCNSCFMQLQTGVSLFLTSCGHMFCQSCLNSGSKRRVCKICQSQCTTMKLAPDMPPDVQDFFSEPSELISKLSTILKFQRKHRMKLTSHWIDTSKKFAVAKEEVKRLNTLCHRLNDAVKDLQQKNRNLKAKLNESRIRDRAISPLGLVKSPNMRVISPTLPQSGVVRPAKSTPYPNNYQSSLVTPVRVTRSRAGSNDQFKNEPRGRPVTIVDNDELKAIVEADPTQSTAEFAAGFGKMMSSQRTNSSGVFLTPSPPTSAGSGYFSGGSYKSPPPPPPDPPDTRPSFFFSMFRRNK